MVKMYEDDSALEVTDESAEDEVEFDENDDQSEEDDPVSKKSQLSLMEESVEDFKVSEITDIPVPPKRELIPVNNLTGLKEKLSSLQLNLEWVERLDISVDTSVDSDKGNSDSIVDNDFKREESFYNQALAAATKAIKRLKKLGIPTKRPDDYYAEMAKSDAHMLKVREKLLSKQTAVERREKVRNIREQKKLGKKMQQEIVQQRKQEKKKMINALKKTKKGKMGADKLLNENKPLKERMKKGQKKREFRDAKYGYGGKKKGTKYNTSESSAMDSMKEKSGKKGKFGKPRPKKHRRRR